MSIAPTKRKVLVIGCGGAGSQYAARASKNLNNAVTVVTPFEYMEVSLSMTKVLASGGEEHNKALFPLLREPNVEYVIDEVISLEDNQAVTKSGQAISFDACVVAVGQHIPYFYPAIGERTMDARREAVSEIQKKIRDANHIVVAGGGPVGVEACADIKLRHKQKKVTLVHSHQEVLAMMSDKFRLLAQAHLEKIGVEIILSDKVLKCEDGKATMESGKTIDCDVYLPCFPTGGNAGSFLKIGSADHRNYAMVDDTFKVKGYDHVFAIGDCSNYDVVKTYPKIEDQMTVLANNVDALLAGKTLQHHTKGSSMMGQVHGPLIVALGHDVPDGYGVGPDFPGTCLPFCCWLCCCFGPPCSTPAGSGVAKMKSDFNATIVPRQGKGISK